MSTGRGQGPFSRLGARQWGALALVAVALVFILQNLAYVRVEFFFVHASAPLWVVLLCTLGVGYLIGWFTSRRD